MSAARSLKAKGLVEAVRQLINAGAIDEVCSGLEAGKLSRQSGNSTFTKLAGGRPAVQTAISNLINAWNVNFPALSNSDFALHLAVIRETALMTEKEATQTEVVWTGPKVEGTFLRTTRQVLKDMISNSKSELLVVGYWLAGNEDYEGVINDIIKLMAKASERGVRITMVLDGGDKGYGRNNRDTLTALWPSGCALPRLLTWETPIDEKHLKLHAKVVVADRQDALVTSANLTMYALDRNIEMGVRIKGSDAYTISHHFELLEESAIIAAYPPEKTA